MIQSRFWTVLIVVFLCGKAVAADPPNPVFEELTAGVKLGEVDVKSPAPSFSDAETEKSELEILAEIAGSTRAVGDFLVDSVSAPIVIKSRDEISKNGDTTRFVDLWFVVRAEPESLDLSRVVGDAAKGQQVEAGNMKFLSVGIPASELEKLRIKAPEHPETEQFVHQKSRLLGRLLVDSSDRITSSTTERSIIVAARTDPRFDRSENFPNRWSTVKMQNEVEILGKPQSYGGSLGYVKATRLRGTPGALLVEVHMVYNEPKGWFNGAPILKSKIGAVAQDRIRKLRRDLEQSRKAEDERKSVK